MRVRHSNRAAVSPVILVAVLLIVFVLVAFVLYPYATRYDGYANDPDAPPAGCTGDPAWQGMFQFDVAVTMEEGSDGDWRPVKLQVPTSYMGPKMLNCVEYDGDPWSTWRPATAAPTRVKVEYSLTLEDDDGNTHTHEDHRWIQGTRANYAGTIKTDWWFFWDEQVGEVFQWDLTVTCGDKVKDRTGTFEIKDDGKVVN